MVFIQVRNVDEGLREAAERRASELGVDLSTYVRGLIQRDIARPSIGSWLDDVLAAPIGEPFDTAAAVEEARRDRASQIREALGETEC
jgi:antitoxin component of RelBE/YafQ-DinJ toxin-antitoxin module